jgi:hypothetical protein
MVDCNKSSEMEQLKSLFDEYVVKSYPEKEFNKEKAMIHIGSTTEVAWGCMFSAPSVVAKYDHGGVSIYYHKRVTTVLGDTDTFVDKKVIVDGKVILNLVKQ